jgi:hypothetical protein
MSNIVYRFKPCPTCKGARFITDSYVEYHTDPYSYSLTNLPDHCSLRRGILLCPQCGGDGCVRVKRIWHSKSFPKMTSAQLDKLLIDVLFGATAGRKEK